MPVSDLEASKAFYVRALKPLGYEVVMEFGEKGGRALGLGMEGKPSFWIWEGEKACRSLHVAFAAGDRATVDAFYGAAIAAGGKDNGKPGVREQYHPNYYGAFVLDPDGNNIEAVCHKPQ
jgi:catechol 2,3-dioxygenase-like lactoylglutathione lyase family enzyme